MADQGIARASTTRGLAAGAAILLLILAGCGPSAASPSATPALASTPQPTADVTASPELIASPAVTPEPTEVAAGGCTPGPRGTSLGKWTILEGQDGDYRFEYPPDWISAGQDIPTSSSVSPETFAETGLPDGTTHHVDLVRAVDESVGVSAWVIEGVSTGTEALFDRELAWLDTQPALTDMLDDDREACFDGSTARGFSFLGFAGARYVVIFVLERNGRMYEVTFIANDPGLEVTFLELINSWEWTEPLQPGTDLDDQFAATDFKVIGMAATLDDTGDDPNESTFQSVFPAMSERIYVIYELDDEGADKVNFSWAQGGRELFTNSFDYKTTTTFAWGWITPPSSGRFATGNYSVTLALEESGDTITVPFTVE